MLKIGSIEDNDGEYIIHREFYRQGMIFKDEEAYKFHKDQPCCSPELSDSVYTGNDFLELCNCQQDLADELFEGVDWQHPESLKEDWFVNGECCGGRYDYPVCSHGRNRVWLRQEQANRNRTLQIYHRCDKNAA